MKVTRNLVHDYHKHANDSMALILCQGYRIWPMMVLAKASDHPARFRFLDTGSFGLAAALKVFIHEFRLRMPIAIDRPKGRGMPHTMASYAMQGTPTLLLFDRQGRLRKQGFGHTNDLALGAEIAILMQESRDVGLSIAQVV